MKFNKIIAAVLTAALLVSFAGCSNGGEEPVNSGENTDSPVERTEDNGSSAPDEESENTTSSQSPETDEPQTEAPETNAPVTEAPGSVPDGYREEGESGIEIISRNGHYMGLMPCWGTLEACERYAAAVNKAAAALPGVNVYSMVIPTSSEFYVPEDLEGFTSNQKTKIDTVAENLNGVTNVDVYSALSAHTNEYIYTRTDHHWQPLGAYYAAEVFAKTAGLSDNFAPLSEYTEVTKDGYMGSLYTYSKSEALYSDPEPFTMYISPNDSALKTTYYDTSFQNGKESDLFVSRDASAYYLSFLGYDYEIAEIQTDCTNGKTLVVMKESYGNALIPFLTQCYQTIYVCDVREFNLNVMDFCKEVNATDLLFAVCTYTPAGGNLSAVESVIG